MLERNLAIAEEIGDIWGRAIALGFLGDVSWELGEHDASRVLVEASLALWQDLGDERGIAQCLESLALLAAGSNASRMAWRVRSVSSARRARLREIVGEPSSPARAAILAQTLARARTDWDRRSTRRPGPRGARCVSEAAVDYALARAPASSAAGSAKPAPTGAIPPLTRREVEVAVRVARGMTNRQIAADLVITERTAETHVLNIVRKLGCANRAQVAAWVAARTPLGEDPGE